ncbi:hypothetical protein F5984_10110 [Rudanella paleaurantiibacter]|uniref:SMI1/KNR4 family protein n=1 Tax=Rudanella paleaurantiibacter TaxID=2614655 RepID=A0A7J5U081_9BACT|nr:hypothetical protein [Rudanella paleaurantiibacter]KAB7731153.1 hypothetical protein F5984_10110 [Rudanella paleaurantiibacter]
MQEKNGLELLVPRTQGEQLNISSFEESNGIKLPPVYKAFIRSYKLLGDDTIINPYNFYYPPQDRTRNFGDANHQNIDVLLGAFYEPVKCMELMNEFYPQEDAIWQQEVFLIGTNDMNHALLVGIGSANLDRIIIDRPDLEPRFISVAEDILDLIRGFSIRPEERMLYGPKLSQLYKNWGEDFWRIRETEAPQQ